MSAGNAPSSTHRQRIAVIGAGISGLGAAFLLSSEHDVTVFESELRPGGHARTVMAGSNRDVAVDTGFIVYNNVNYPHLTALFDHLGISPVKSDMSFGICADDGELEFGLQSLSAVFGQRSNLLKITYWRMLRDILKFNKHAVATVGDSDMTLQELLTKLKLGDWFKRYYILPMAGAIWSTSTNRIMDFPARTLTRFFQNHALLQATGQHQWWSVRGGSIEYVTRLVRMLEKRGVEIRLGDPVVNVVRDHESVSVRTGVGEDTRFDHVVFACHTDQALAMLAKPSASEIEYLGAIKYQPNTAILHSDKGQMAQRRACWASWTYQAIGCDEQPGISLTYWMNQLQELDADEDIFVTLNPVKPVDPTLIYDTYQFHHPVFDRAAIEAQQNIQSIQGDNRTYFCGAYMSYGFHEDGLKSAVDVAGAMGVPALWQ